MANFCTQCGSPLADGAKFCTVCGKQFTAPAQNPVCAACGSPLKEGVKFCTVCGTPVETAPKVAYPAAARAAAQPVQQPQPQAAPQPQTYAQPQTYQQPVQPQYQQPMQQSQTQQQQNYAWQVQQAQYQQAQAMPTQTQYQQPFATSYAQVYGQPQAAYAAPPKKKGSFLNVLLVLICAGLIYLGIRTIPENLRDARLPVNPFTGTEEMEPAVAAAVESDYETLTEGGSLLEEGSYLSDEERASMPTVAGHSFADWLYGDD